MNAPNDMLYVASIPYIDAYVRGDWLGGYGINWWGASYKDKTLLMEKVSACVDIYNASIQDVVARMKAEGKPIAFSDINGVVDYQTDLADGCHPNEIGYEKMGAYWANLILNDYFDGQESVVTKPVVTTTTDMTTTTTATTSVTTDKTTTSAPATTTTVSTTTTVKPVIPSGNDIVIENVSFGESYDLSAYKSMGINSASFVFESMPPYGMNGCAVFGNWELSQNYTSDDLENNVSLDKEYSSVKLHKWYGDVQLSKIILHTANSQDNTETTTVTTTTNPTTTTKPTTAPTTTTIVNQDNDENSVVLTDVDFGKEYSLKDYDYNSISKIVIKWKGDVGYGFGGTLVLGSWTVQNSYGHNDMTDDGTIEIVVTKPQDKFTLYRYWGSIDLESVTLYF